MRSTPAFAGTLKWHEDKKSVREGISMKVLIVNEWIRTRCKPASPRIVEETQL